MWFTKGERKKIMGLYAGLANMNFVRHLALGALGALGIGLIQT